MTRFQPFAFAITLALLSLPLAARAATPEDNAPSAGQAPGAEPPCIATSNQILTSPGRVVLKSKEKTKAFNATSGAVGVFSEIGAGQEVSAFFFKGKQASKSIMKVVSAYGKEASDAMYGPAKRFVSEERLHQQLEVETAELMKLQKNRPADTRYFVFADTVTTSKNRGLGWMGLRFQLTPGGEFNEITLHVRLQSGDILEQHKTLGKLGVNLTHSAYFDLSSKDNFIRSLHDNIDPGQFEIDAIKFSGPELAGIDNRLIGLDLLKHDLAKALLFDPKGNLVPPYEALWGRAILAYRGHLQESTRQKFSTEPGVEPDKTIYLESVGLDNLSVNGELDEKRFIALAEEPDWILITKPMADDGLADFVGTLNAKFAGVQSATSNPESDFMVPDPTGKRKTQVKIYSAPPADRH